MPPSFYVTTPIYYVNDVPHIGHAYTTIAADVVARYHRLIGDDVFFLTGVDEHGQKVQQAASKARIDPQTHCDRLMPQFQHLWKLLNISNDAFIRTTDSSHQTVVQHYLQHLFEKGLIYGADYTGWYCAFDERFWTDKDVEQGLCPDCHRPVEQLSERNYFFRMSQFQKQLIAHIQDHPDFIRPASRQNEVLGFLQKPLADLSISRPKSRLSWGITIPFDPSYVTYVWFDALVNYVSALDYLPASGGHAHYWPANLHLVGKDILTTHAIYWSTMLMALDLPLPRTLFAHGWWTVDGEKMSKSRGNVVDPCHIVQAFGADAFRYFLLREVPFGQDGDFSELSMIGRINSDLANGLGNLLSRTIALIQRFADGVVPNQSDANWTTLEVELKEAAETLVHETLPFHLHPTRLDFHRLLESIWGLIQLGNQYIDKTEPWVLAKQPAQRPRLHIVLATTIEILRFLCVAISPLMPDTAQEMNRQLGLGLHLDRPILAKPFHWGGAPPGTNVRKGKSLFPRIDTTALPKGAKNVTSNPITQEERATDQHSTDSIQQTTSEEQKISIQDFQKIQLKVATILTAERVPQSNKLLKLQVNLGSEQRQIVAGIGKTYEPDQLIGRTVIIVANLKPAKLMGIESQGMVLAAGEQEALGLLTLVEDVPQGTAVR